MLAIANAIVPVFLVILIGALARRYVIRDEAQWAGIERASYHLLFPALLVATLAKADLGKVAAGAAGLTLQMCVVGLGILLIALRRPVSGWLALDGPGFTSLVQGACRWNTAVALSIAGALFGEPGVTVAAVAAIAIIAPLNVLSVWVLARHGANQSRPDWLSVLRLLAINPFIWSTALGIMLNLTGLPVPTILMSVADILGRAALGTGLLIVGAGLQLAQLARPRRATLAATALRLLLLPGAVILIGPFVGLTGAALASAAICAGVPTASAGYVLARQMGGDAPLVAEILTIQTVAALGTLPLMIAVAGLAG